MSNIYDIKKYNNINLYDFLNGNRSSNYTVPEEMGFPTTGNIGSIINTNPNELSNINNGILYNPTNKTNSNETIIGRINPSKKDWKILKTEQPETPLLYCNEQQLSDLLPFYPNGIPNKIINPTCNMTINGVASPTLAGISLMGINNSDIINNPYNDIGHQLNAYGFANENGTRALGQGKVSCQELTEGLNVPPLKLEKNNNNAFVTNPSITNPNVPLYQVGDWSNKNLFPNNFINVFNQNVGNGC